MQLLLKSTVVKIVSIIVVSFTILLGFSLYFLLGSHASNSSDVITGTASFVNSTQVHILANFHRTNNSAYLGFMGCHLGNQYYPVGGPATNTSYVLNKIVPVSYFSNNTLLNCAGNEYQSGKPIPTASASFTPYGIISGGVTLNTQSANTTINLIFHRIDNQAFTGYFMCAVANHGFPVGAPPNGTTFTLNKVVPSNYFANGNIMSCSGSQYFDTHGHTVTIAHADFSPYDVISGGVSLSGSTVNVAVHFHRINNTPFLGYFDCKAGSINITVGGSQNTTDYYAHGSYPVSQYGKNTMVCKGSEYQGTTPVLNGSKSYSSPYSGYTPPPVNGNTYAFSFTTRADTTTYADSVVIYITGTLTKLSGSSPMPALNMKCTNGGNFPTTYGYSLAPVGNSVSQLGAFAIGSTGYSYDSIDCTAYNGATSQVLGSASGTF